MPELYTQIRRKRFTLMLAFVAVFTLLLCNPCNSPGLEHWRETAVVRAVRKVSPVVVNISAESVVRKRVHPFSGLSMDPYCKESHILPPLASGRVILYGKLMRQP